MATKFKKDEQVRQIMPAPIVGAVGRFHFSPETGEMQYEVSWKDAEGVEHRRVFNEDQIEAVEDAATAAEDAAASKNGG
jgi:hypothetical protein